MLKAVQCERENCKGYVVWNEKLSAFVCEACETLYDEEE
jgi:hypothetical protein